jgi:tetratricopeptide (TPR) repeat protein
MMEDRERFDRGVLMEAMAESALKRGKLKSARRAASEIVDENARKLFLKIVDYLEGAEYVFPFRIIGKNVLGDRWGYFVQLLRQENIPSAINLINSKPPEPIYRRICSTLVEIYVPPTSSIEEELLMGYLYFYDDSYYHAIYLWEKAISKGADQKYPWIYYYIGRAYYHLDEYADSFYAIKRFVEWDTDNFLEKEAGNSSE